MGIQNIRYSSVGPPPTYSPSCHHLVNLLPQNAFNILTTTAPSLSNVLRTDSVLIRIAKVWALHLMNRPGIVPFG
jgi:hypothetical protein